ncbi:hypothetical protein ACFRAR_21065 [Kitasatospora sp. NPDC056651]|uniref:hypothetical protein n=1 Tax=Kitasatospora sp. NPDC056651 TaxID=3345892 RepID=UPI0036D1253A
MTPIPAVRIGPSRLKDASLALPTLLLLGAALPVAAFYLVCLVGIAAGFDGGDDGDGSAWATLAVAFMAAPVIALAVSVVTAVRSVRSGYRLLPVAAAIAPFVLPALLSSGALR